VEHASVDQGNQDCQLKSFGCHFGVKLKLHVVLMEADAFAALRDYRTLTF
jgi:hypothetical protein